MTKEDWQEFKEEINQEVIKPAKRSIKKNWKKWLKLGYWHFKTVCWFGYSGLAFLYFLITIILEFKSYTTWYAWDLALIIINFFLIEGIVFYVSKAPPVLSHLFWKRLFWLNIFIFGSEIIFLIPGFPLHFTFPPFFQTNNLTPFTSLSDAITTDIWFIPALYAVFKLGYMNKWPKQKENPEWAWLYHYPRRIVRPRQLKRFRDDVAPIQGTFASVKPIRID